MLSFTRITIVMMLCSILFLVTSMVRAKEPKASSHPASKPSTRPTKVAHKKVATKKPTQAVKLSTNPTFVRQAAFQILFNRCGRCHIRSLSTSKPEALQVFDLEKSRWWSTIKASQLVTLRTIFDEAPGSFTKEEVRQIRQFVNHEIKLRPKKNSSTSK